MNDANLHLAGLLKSTAEVVMSEFREELEQTEFADIRPTHGCIFRFVGDEGMRLTRLAELANLTKQSVGEIVDDLTELGYVERASDPDDRRAKLIRLTERGIRAQRLGHEISARIEARLSDRYGADRVAALRALLEEIVAAEAPGAVPELAGSIQP